MARMCLTHKDTPAAVMCFHCHRPLCEACVKQNAAGSFCSRLCAQNFEIFHSRVAPGRSKRGFPMRRVVGILILAAAAFLAYKFHLIDKAWSWIKSL